MHERAAYAGSQREHGHDAVRAARADAKVALRQRGTPSVVAQVHVLAPEPEGTAQRARAVGQLREGQLKKPRREVDGLEPAEVGEVARRAGRGVDVAGHRDTEAGERALRKVLARVAPALG